MMLQQQQQRMNYPKNASQRSVMSGGRLFGFDPDTQGRT